MDISEIINKVKELKQQIASCKDDKKAIDLQQQLVKIFIESLKNKEILSELIKNKLAF